MLASISLSLRFLLTFFLATGDWVSDDRLEEREGDLRREEQPPPPFPYLQYIPTPTPQQPSWYQQGVEKRREGGRIGWEEKEREESLKVMAWRRWWKHLTGSYIDHFCTEPHFMFLCTLNWRVLLKNRRFGLLSSANSPWLIASHRIARSQSGRLSSGNSFGCQRMPRQKEGREEKWRRRSLEPKGGEVTEKKR